MFSGVSAVYDEINGEAYLPYAEYLVKECFSCASIPVREVLDLGCGTGGICAILAKRGYDMVGIDISDGMLNAAFSNNAGLNTLLLCQDMRGFELYGTVQAVYSSFDCINYLLSAEELQKVFSLVHNYLEPGGVFCFDVNTPFRYKNVFDGRSYCYETPCFFAATRAALSDDGDFCDFTIDVFSDDGSGKWERESERQTQRVFGGDEIEACAKGFTLLKKTGGKGFDGCAPEEKDYYVFKRDD
ncbi:MAG: class I SAM-dependent methyltransferase [Clostridia bacterium]|nr:class I SAM-dependent methyltransferase [Clostridia bacterium]